MLAIVGAGAAADAPPGAGAGAGFAGAAGVAAGAADAGAVGSGAGAAGAAGAGGGVAGTGAAGAGAAGAFGSAKITVFAPPPIAFGIIGAAFGSSTGNASTFTAEAFGFRSLRLFATAFIASSIGIVTSPFALSFHAGATVSAFSASAFNLSDSRKRITPRRSSSLSRLGCAPPLYFFAAALSSASVSAAFFFASSPFASSGARRPSAICCGRSSVFDEGDFTHHQTAAATTQNDTMPPRPTKNPPGVVTFAFEDMSVGSFQRSGEARILRREKIALAEVTQEEQPEAAADAEPREDGRERRAE